MTLTMHTIERNTGIITGYRFVGPYAERETQIHILAWALSDMTPLAVAVETMAVTRKTIAALSLQLAGLLDGWDGNKSHAVEVLNKAHYYLTRRRDNLMHEDQVDATTAGYRLIEGYAYFDYDWSAILDGAA